MQVIRLLGQAYLSEFMVFLWLLPVVCLMYQWCLVKNDKPGFFLNLLRDQTVVLPYPKNHHKLACMLGFFGRFVTCVFCALFFCGFIFMCIINYTSKHDDFNLIINTGLALLSLSYLWRLWVVQS